MPTSESHEDIVRREFTKQAEAYAANASLHDQERVARLVQAIHPTPHDRILEVATGPGYVAMALATLAHEVVGVDLTEAPLAIAEKMRQERGLTNVRFETADASRLPFADVTFDAVVCRFAFHHFQKPSDVLREMVRVCRLDGTVAVEDLVVSEHVARAAYQNRFERLRDPSHTEAWPLSQLLARFAEAGLEVEHVQTGSLTPIAEQWMDNTQTPADRAAQVRHLLEEDEVHDLSGTRPFRNREGHVCFTQRTAIVIGRRLRP